MKNSLRMLLAAVVLANAPAHAGNHADLQIVSRSTGQQLPVYAHGGKLYVAGQPGERYAIQVTNKTRGRVLAVMSVDGVNVVSGETAAPDQTGYVLSPQQTYEVAGWRKSSDEVAAFYFTALPDSYAARTNRPGNVGVIGVALFREWLPPRPRPQVLPRMEDGLSAAPLGESLAQRQDAREAAAESPASPAPSMGSSASADTARAPARAAPQQPRDKLGTGHGEREYAAVSYTDFRRATAAPSEVLTIHYDRYENLVARGIVPGTPHYAEPQPFPGRRQFVPDPRS